MAKRSVVIVVSILLATTKASSAQSPYGIGRTATPLEIAGWNTDVGPNGRGLPAGSGSVGHGRDVYQNQCATCHGDQGQGGIGDRLVGGQGTLATSKPIRTVGSYWPYAPPLFDYVHRAMPQNAPGSLSNEDVYAVSAYILHLNGLLPANAVLDANGMAAIKMPNRKMFVDDVRPDVKTSACMSNC